MSSEKKRLYCSAKTAQLIAFGACLRDMTKTEFVDQVVSELVARHNHNLLTLARRGSEPASIPTAK